MQNKRFCKLLFTKQHIYNKKMTSHMRVILNGEHAMNCNLTVA